ncbi:MAG: ribosome-associated translation inhibitor RaiA [bacterium]
MHTTITARHFELTDEIRERTEADIEGLTRYFENIISADMVLEKERHRYSAELRVKVFNNTLNATAETDDMYTAIAAAVEKAKTQLKKHKGKLKEKRPEEIAETIGELTRPSTDPESLDM